jgi:hypothetical protein
MISWVARHLQARRLRPYVSREAWRSSRVALGSILASDLLLSGDGAEESLTRPASRDIYSLVDDNQQPRKTSFNANTHVGRIGCEYLINSKLVSARFKYSRQPD